MTLQKISALGFAICSLALGAAYYLEQQYMLAACHLCILQRIIFASLAVVFLIGMLIKIRGSLRYAYSGTLVFLSIIGMALAARQIWLQYFSPPQKISCSSGLANLLEVHPALEVLRIALSGSGECATVDFTIFGLSIAVWGFMIFSSICLAMIYIIFLQKKRWI